MIANYKDIIVLNLKTSANSIFRYSSPIAREPTQSSAAEKV
jgi:hypothetical protein